MSRDITKGATGQSIYVTIGDSTSTTGGKKTGLLFNTAGLTAYYVRNGGSPTAITLATLAAANSAWSSGGFKEVDATNMPGLYRLDVPDASIAAGSGDSIVYTLKGATGMVQVDDEVQLIAWNNQDAVRAGLTALPNANAGAAGGLVVLGANATAISFTGGVTISNATGDALTLTSSGSNGNAINASGNGSGAGAKFNGGATGNGVAAVGGATSGSAIKATGTAGNAIGLELVGQGSAAGASITGGATGHGIAAVGGATSGDGINAVASTSGHGLTATGVGTTKHGINATGGSTTSHGISATGGGVGHGILATSGGGATGDGIKAVAASTNGNGINTAGVGTGAGTISTGGATGHGVSAVGGATSGDGLRAAATTSGVGITATGVGTSKAGIAATGGSTSSDGISAAGGGTGNGITATGGATGNGAKLVGGSSSGHGLAVTTTSGDGFNITPTAGNGITATANGTSKHGIVATGGTAGTSDGLKAAAGTGGVDIRGSITGSLSGSIGSVTTGGIVAASFAANALDAVWSTAVRLLTAGTNIVLVKDTGVTGFNDLSASAVNAEVVDALATDTYAEPGQGAPGATISLAAKINYLFKAWRNRHTQTDTMFKLYGDDGTTVDQKATVADDGTTFDRAEIVSGP